MLRFKLILLVAAKIAIVNLLFCQQSTSPATQYVRQVIKNLKEEYYFIEKINLDSIEKKVSLMITDSGTAKGAYPAVKELLNSLYEKHSGFLTPQEANKYLNDLSEIVFPTLELEKEVGYILIPHYTSSETMMVKWADTIAHFIMNNKNVKGWIIDLRGNYGGSHLPMIAGISPLLGEGIIFSEKNRSGQLIQYKVLNGRFVQQQEGRSIYSFPSSYKTQNNFAELPVAVLIDTLTASGGEITALALMRCKNLKIFGENSSGYPTINKVFLMPDKAILYLVNKIIIDFSGKEWIEKISPHVQVNQEPVDKNDRTIKMAFDWINSQQH